MRSMTKWLCAVAVVGGLAFAGTSTAQAGDRYSAGYNGGWGGYYPPRPHPPGCFPRPYPPPVCHPRPYPPSCYPQPYPPGCFPRPYPTPYPLPRPYPRPW